MFQDPQHINYKFIVICNKFTEPIAQSIYNRAIGKGITSTVWDEKIYNAQKAKLTNANYLLLLNDTLIKTNLADPMLVGQNLFPGVMYKKQGHQLGIFIDKNQNPIKAADLFASIAKEDWGKIVLTLIASGIVGVSTILAPILYFNKKKRAKFYLYMKAIDKFDKEFLEKFVNDEL